MSFFSIVIPAYSNASLISSCLNSIKNQSFTDWEAIVVNDASPDNMAEILALESAQDKRIIVINKPANEGRHLARKTGLEAAAGDYVLFVDADDELMPDALEQLASAAHQEDMDLLRFGVLVESSGASQEACDDYQKHANRQFPVLSGQESVQQSYDPAYGFQQGWRTWGSVLTRELAVQAFHATTNQRLDRAEDALEFLAFASLAKKQVTRTDIVGYRYRFGSGISGTTTLSAQEICDHARQFATCLDAINEYAASFHRFDLTQAARGAHIKLYEIMFNDWMSRLPDSEKEKSIPRLVDVFGEEVVATQLMRLIRDITYNKTITGASYDPTEEWVAWLNTALELMSHTDKKPSLLYQQVSIPTLRYVEQLRASTRLESQAQQDIRIFVATHNDTRAFDSNILQLVQVGAEQAPYKYPSCFKDNEGDNISSRNPMYCELTAQYWAWKNVEADYYGLCHYRRYFNFSDTRYEENEWGEIIDDTINAESQKRYNLDDDSIRKAIESYDVITTEFKTISDFPGEAQTPMEQWQEAASLYDNDLIDALAIARELYPDYAQDIDAFLSGPSACFCNMFVMRKGIFHDYCHWLFSILDLFVSTRDMSHYSREALRTPGHLAERLLNIYLLHHQRIGSGWNMKQYQCVHFQYTASVYPPLPPSESESKHKPIIPVVFAANDEYVPMLAATMYSTLTHASDAYCYDISIFTDGISDKNQIALRELAQNCKTAHLRFFEVHHLMDTKSLTTNNMHIGVETYYRFLIQDVLPEYDKVLYLDSDLIVRSDISELFNTDLGHNLIAAVRDVDFLGNLNLKDGERLRYSNSILGMTNPYDYFQAGVLVLNTAALRDEIPSSIWLEHAADTRYIYNDQDILNIKCEGRVVYLDPAWNVMHDGDNRIEAVCSSAPKTIFDEYMNARQNERIIHYAGVEKPWNSATCDRKEEFWHYARQTPFYEDLLVRLILALNTDNQFADWRFASDESVVRRIVDVFLPPESPRRARASNLVRIALRMRG